MSDIDGNESIDPAVVGHCAQVEERRLGDCRVGAGISFIDDFLFFEGLSTRDDVSLSVVLRGANDMMLQEMERSFHDALCVEQRVMESKSLVVGGGAVETALYLHLQEYALSLATNEQLAVEAFGKALLAVAAAPLLSGIVGLLGGTDGFALAAAAVLVIGTGIGVGCIAAVQKKYNGGMF